MQKAYTKHSQISTCLWVFHMPIWALRVHRVNIIVHVCVREDTASLPVSPASILSAVSNNISAT